MLTFHRVLESGHSVFPDWPTAQEFSDKISWFKKCVRIVALSDGIDAVIRGSSVENLGAITFDDGYLDNCTVALPILLRHQVPASFFVSTRYLDGQMMFDDAVIQAVLQSAKNSVSLPEIGLEHADISTSQAKRAFIDFVLEKLKYLTPTDRDSLVTKFIGQMGLKNSDRSMMGEWELKILRDNGMEIGSHSHDHNIPTTIASDEFTADVKKSKDILEGILGQPPTIYAFPNGQVGRDFDSNHERILKSLGFDAALSTSPGVITKTSNLYSLPRIAPWPSSQARFIAHLLRSRL